MEAQRCEFVFVVLLQNALQKHRARFDIAEFEYSFLTLFHLVAIDSLSRGQAGVFFVLCGLDYRLGGSALAQLDVLRNRNPSFLCPY